MIKATNYEGNKDYDVLTGEDVVDGLTSTSATTPLSANQGKVLKGLIDGIDVGTDPEVTQDINQLKTQMGTANSNIGKLQTQMGTANSNISELQSSDTQQDSDISAIKAKLKKGIFFK